MVDSATGVIDQIGTKLGEELGSVGKSCSFAATTLVRTTEGDVPISQIEPGDRVVAEDESSGTTAAYPVTAVWSHEDQVPALRSTACRSGSHQTIRSRPLIAAGSRRLTYGSANSSSPLEGAPGTLDTVRWDGGPASMWNLTVALAHAYTVGTGGWLVHNACPPHVQKTLDEIDVTVSHCHPMSLNR